VTLTQIMVKVAHKSLSLSQIMRNTFLRIEGVGHLTYFTS